MKSSLLLIGLLLIVLTVAATAEEKRAAVTAIAPQLVWPPPPDVPRIRWVTELRSEVDVGAQKKRGFIDKLAGAPEEMIRLVRPIAVALDENGVIYVGDFHLGVIAMDRTGHRMWSFSKVSGRNMPQPVGVAADSKLVYVTDSLLNTVSVFDKQGNFLAGLGSKDGINKPVGIAVDEERDLLLVVNSGEHNVLIFNRSLKLIKKVGDRGGQEAQLNFPTYVCFIPETGFAVTDTGNFRVQIFDYNGRFIRSFGAVGDGPGALPRRFFRGSGPFRNVSPVRLSRSFPPRSHHALGCGLCPVSAGFI